MSFFFFDHGKRSEKRKKNRRRIYVFVYLWDKVSGGDSCL